MHTPLLAAILRPETLSLRHPEAKARVAEALTATTNVGREIVEKGQLSPDLLAKIQKPLLSRELFFANADGWWR